MAVGKETLWERFLQPVVRLFIDESSLRQQHENTDWERMSDRLRNPQLVYPDYYRSQNFHGIKGGYLTPGAAVTYDPVTQYFLPPNETWVRQDALEVAIASPRRILDLGCGTGSTTLMLARAFPQAEVIGVDLSPYMLVVAQEKARAQGFDIRWLHGKAEATGLEANSFDLVSAALLFHETPPRVTLEILREAFRLLKAGGQFLMLDGNQQLLHQTPWLMEIFEEPYIQPFAAGKMNDWLHQAGFEQVNSREVWWLHQVSWGIKPLPVYARTQWSDRGTMLAPA